MESALDRFARTRGAALLGLTAMGRQWKIQTAVGGALVGLAGVMGMVALAVHEIGMIGAVLGPGLAGAINLGLGLGFRKAAKRQGPPVTLTAEATSLLRALVMRAQVWQRSLWGNRHFGIGVWSPNHGPLYGTQTWPGHRAPVQPSASMMDALERGAAAHNRVTDALGEAKDERAIRLRVAADAGMGEALHLAATDADAIEIERVVERLDELATLVERSVERAEAPSALRSNLEATLEELRAEDVARQELRG